MIAPINTNVTSEVKQKFKAICKKKGLTEYRVLAQLVGDFVDKYENEVEDLE